MLWITTTTTTKLMLWYTWRQLTLLFLLLLERIRRRLSCCLHTQRSLISSFCVWLLNINTRILRCVISNWDWKVIPFGDPITRLLLILQTFPRTDSIEYLFCNRTDVFSIWRRILLRLVKIIDFRILAKAARILEIANINDLYRWITPRWWWLLY